jgi:predicted phosphoadenosine phosphosulfate sulfurtransferase
MRNTGTKLYLQQNVLDAAKARIEMVFERHDPVFVSVSGGKDSSVLFDLAHREAVRRGRMLDVFFLDQEAEYQSTVEVVRDIMAQTHVRPHWLQVPVRMTNATSYAEEFLFAWQPGKTWMREKERNATATLPGAPDRFYPLIEWFEAQQPNNSAFLVGLRSDESLNRYYTVTRHPASSGITWSSSGSGGATKYYPLYDWTFEDIWTYIADERITYNRVYDWQWIKGRKMREMRVSNLIHEKAFRSLADLQEFEPDTYNRLLCRLGGVRTAAIYSREETVFSAKRRPAQFRTWRAYRDYLLDTYTGGAERKARFQARFAKQPKTEIVYRQQVAQLLINDWENSIPVDGKTHENPVKKWMNL